MRHHHDDAGSTPAAKATREVANRDDAVWPSEIIDGDGEWPPVIVVRQPNKEKTP
jgi:hypothetical protein